MNTAYIRFVPDGHYGYPEHIITQDLVFPEYRDEILNLWCASTYSHDPDEYDGEDAFDQWGNKDVYGNIYIISLDGSNDDMKSIAQEAYYGVEADIYEARYDISNSFMEEIKRDPRIIGIACVPIWSGMNFYSLGNLEGIPTDTIGIISDEIIKLIRDNNFEKAADFFREFNNFSGLDDIIRSNITDDEYSKLITFSRGGGIMKRFGV
jgi:hypothetical protein